MRIVFLLPILLLALHEAPVRAEIVDRIVAVVDGRVITRSAALEEENVRAFQNGEEPVGTLMDQELHRLIPRMIDQELLAKEKDNSPFSPADAGDAIEPLEAIRKRYPSSEEYRKALARYQLSDQDLVRHLSRERDILAFVDYRLRPQVLLAPDAVETYYQNVLLPQLGKERQAREGQAQDPQSTVPTLEDVRGQIERILTEQEINRLLDEWLKQLRSRAKIGMLLDSK
jgi:hypothetical protein